MTSQAPRRRTQAERRNQSEQGLLLAAAETIVDEGFAGATFDRISERAGYSRGMVTLRFGSRDGLFRALIDFLAARMREHYASVLVADASPVQELQARVESFLARLLEDRTVRAYFVLLSAAVGNRLEQAAYFFEQHELVKAELADAIWRGQGQGQIDATLDPVITATGIGALLLGIAMQSLLEPDLDIAALSRSARALLALLVAPAAGS